MTPEAPLAALLPAPDQPPLDDAQVLDRFVSWVSSSGLSLYPAQEEALLELLEGRHVVLATPTGSGKSMVANFLHFQCMARGERSFYTCPIKALVNEKFFDLCRLFGPENVGMMTGDGAVNRDAPIVCCTAEILMNVALREANPRVDAVVMDEFHYYGDRDRGVAWQVPLLLLEKARFLLMSATLGDVGVIADGLVRAHRPEARRGAQRRPPRPPRLHLAGDAAPRDHRGAGLGGSRAGLPGELHPAGRGRAGAESDVREVLLPGGEGPDQGGARRLPLRHPLRQGPLALPAPRRGAPPRRAPAEVPAARGEAGAAGDAQGRVRDRHAGHGREHPHPDGALLPALQVRRARRPPSWPPATSARSPDGPVARASTTAATWWPRPPSTSSRTSGSPRSRRPARRSRRRSRRRRGTSPGTGSPSSGSRSRRPSRWRAASR